MKFIKDLSNSLKSKIDDNMKDAYLDLFHEVIMLDGSMHENEKILYDFLCKQWGKENRIL